MAQSDPEQPNQTNPSSEPKAPQEEPNTPDLWTLLTTKEQVEDYLKRAIQVIHGQGFFVSGQITIDDKRTCPNCHYQMTWVPNLQRHECSKCMAQVVEAFSTQSKTGDLNLETAYSGADTKLCDNCGNISVRTGTCYTCQTCGTNSGCG